MRPIYIVTMAVLLGVALLFPACKGSNGPAGPAGASSVPTPYCSSPSSQGVTTAGASYGNTTGYIEAIPVTLSADTTAVSLLVNVASGPVSGQIIMGIYTDNAGTPANLVAESNYQNITVGWDSVAIPATTLPAATYWIAVNYSQSFNITYNSGGTFYKSVYGWGELPTAFPAGGSGAFTLSMYMNTCP